MAQAARRYDGNALQTLVAIMNDDTATAAARVRCAELILDRAHGKPAYLEDPNRDPDFVPLAERLKAYVRRDQILAAGKSCNYRPRPTRLLQGRALSVPSSCHLAPCHERLRLKTTRSDRRGHRLSHDPPAATCCTASSEKSCNLLHGFIWFQTVRITLSVLQPVNPKMPAAI